MAFTHFSHNGSVRPIAQAVIPLSSVEYSYGFGVYETIRYAKGKTYFLAEHCNRLLESARIIGLEHTFELQFVQNAVTDLLAQNKPDACNIKVLLIGGATPSNANLYIQCLNPLFVKREFYKNGAATITQSYVRPFPHAKTLNMLPSYLAYREAKRAGAYDALLINQKDELIEGTRTNVLAFKNQTIVSPPSEHILLGVTRDKVLEVAQSHGYHIEERSLLLAEVQAGAFDDIFLTSTSTKIMPVRTIDGHDLGPPSSNIQTLMRLFQQSFFESS